MKAAIIVLLLTVVPPLQVIADENKARVITSVARTAQCISPVRVTQIDGRTVNVPRAGFSIEPGHHTLKGRSLINTSVCRTVGIGTGQTEPPPLEAEFEAGKTYYFGIDHSAPNRRDWKYVIWKVEEKAG